MHLASAGRFPATPAATARQVDRMALHGGERLAQADLLRDVFNFYRPVVVEPDWLAWDGGTVRTLAEAAYDDRALPDGLLDLDQLGVLADALEDAGCADDSLLPHLR